MDELPDWLNPDRALPSTLRDPRKYKRTIRYFTKMFQAKTKWYRADPKHMKRF